MGETGHHQRTTARDKVRISKWLRRRSLPLAATHSLPLASLSGIALNPLRQKWHVASAVQIILHLSVIDCVFQRNGDENRERTVDPTDAN